MPARILVNDRCLLVPGAGVSVYLENTLRHWPGDAALQPARFWGARADAGAQPRQPTLQLRPLAQLDIASGPGRRLPRSLRRLTEAVHARQFAWHFRRGGYAAYFEPNYLAVPCQGCTVTTAFDLSVLEHPQWHPADRVHMWACAFQRSVAVTDHWITSTIFSRNRMVALLGLDANRIEVIPLAARDLPYPAADTLQALKAEAGLPDRYVVHLGTLEPRKNLITLLDAYAELPARMRDGVALILVGAPGWGDAAWWRALAEHRVADRVLTTDRVSDAHAALLLAAATVVAIPSRYEGFGLPILEAMACARPVICSDIPPFREVARGAADHVASDDVDGWTEALRRAIDDQAWREQRGAAGLQRSGQFSWRRTAEAHARLFARLCAGSSVERPLRDPDGFIASALRCARIAPWSGGRSGPRRTGRRASA